MTKKFRFFTLTVGAVLLMAMFFTVGGLFTGVSSMKCKKSEPAEIDNERANLEMRPRYVLEKEGHATVYFQFNLDIRDHDETLFSIFSNLTRTSVYLGPYKHNLLLEMDAHLAANQGYDNLEFQLLQLKQKQSCRWANERGYPYWRANAKIKIDFLDEGTFDKDNLFKQFEVEIH